MWRDPRTVQLGTDPSRATVLEFREPSSAHVLDLIDGTRSEDELLDHAVARLGIDAPGVLEILATLRAAGLLIDAEHLLPAGLSKPARERLLVEASALLSDLVPAARYHRGTASHPSPTEPTGPGRPAKKARCPAEALRRRAATHVLVTGCETLVSPVAIALATAGVGHVAPTVDGRHQPSDLIAAITAAAPETTVSPLKTGTASVIVRVGTRALSAPAARGRRAATLDVAIRDGVVFVGPMVLPTGSPCGRCLDLHRRDRDPAWPILAAQLATQPSGADHCTLTTALTGAALAVEEVLRLIDGRVWRTAGAMIEVRGPADSRRRSWTTHPRCDCRRRQPTCASG